MTARAQTVTILFTDLVGSTELLQRAGDEQAQAIFKAHHRLLSEAVALHHGHEVKWLGDGLMVAFDSAADAVRCAIAMQQSSRRPASGERLEIRVGLNVGEAFVDEADYFGIPVVVARRLCDRAVGGQILASDIVLRLLDERGGGIDARDMGALELKGVAKPVPAVELVYEHDPLALLRKLPFVGRQSEFDVLMKKLSDAITGRGAVVLLAGEPGIGKTRLTEEFCERAASRATVVRGNCYEESPPFGPWTEALRALIEQLTDEQLRAALGTGGPEVVAMLPELNKRLPDIDEGPRLDAEAQRARFVDSIVAFVQNAAEHRPLVLFFDDLHWCDRPSLLLLTRVAYAIPDRAVLIVGTYRDVEIDRMHPLAQTLPDLRKLEHHERIAVRGLSEASVYDLLSAIESSEEGAEARHALAVALDRDAQGNPLFIREVFNSLVETGRLNLRERGWGDASAIEELGIPEGVREVIGRRLSRLSDGCNQMLQMAAAIGPRFTWDQLRAVAATASGAAVSTEEEVLNQLDEALRAQLLTEQPGLSYAFTHALIAATLYDELSGPRRVLLHRRIAAALESLYASDLDAHAPELAHHFYEAALGGDVEKAIAYSCRAADRALQQYAWEEAVRHYERALQVADLAPALDERLRIDLLIELSNARLVEGGDETKRQDVAESAIDLARTVDDRERFARAVLAWAGPHREDGVTNPRLIALLEEAIASVGAGDSSIRARLLARLSAALFFLPAERERRAALIEEALAIARRLSDNDALMYVLRLAVWIWNPDTARAQIANADEMLALARQAADPAMSMEAYAMFIGPSLELADRDAADAWIGAYAEAQRGVRRPGWSATWRAMTAMMEGRLRDASRLISEGYRELLKFNPENASTTIGLQTWNLRRQQGRLAELEAAVRDSARRYPEVPGYVPALCMSNLAAGHVEEARSNFEILASVHFAQFTVDRNWTTSFAYLADACAALRDRPRAELLYAMILPYGDLCVVTSTSCIAIDYAGSLQLRLGNLSAIMERWREAEHHYETAIATELRMRASAWLAQTQLDYARMLASRARDGDIEKAKHLLDEAHAFAQESGMEAVRQAAEQLAASLQDLKSNSP